MTTRKEVLEKAVQLTTSDRNKTHGEPWDNLGHIAQLWSSYLGVNVSRTDVAHMNQLQKMSRYKHGAYNPDDFFDNVGYGAIAGEMAHRENGLNTPETVAAVEKESEPETLIAKPETVGVPKKLRDKAVVYGKQKDWYLNIGMFLKTEGIDIKQRLDT